MKLIEPGKWYSEFDEKGNCTVTVYDASYRKLLGYESEEEYANAQESWTNAIFPEDNERLENHYADCIAKHPEGMDYDIEYRMMTKWGYRWFHDYAHIIRREDGSPVRADGIVFDIQDIVEKEDVHQALSENYTRILALEDDFEVLYDVELETGKYEIFVKGQTFGDVNRTLINNNSFFDDVEKNLQVVHPDDRQGNFDTTRPDFIRTVLSKDDHFDRYYRLMVDGTPAWARMRIVYKDARKKNIIIGVFNAANDVEAKQIAEQKEQLEIQQKQLKDALEAANFETKRNDVLTGIVRGSKFTYDISADDEVIGAHYSQVSIDRIGKKFTTTPMMWVELMHPEDKDQVYADFMASIHDHTGRTPYDVTFRMMGMDGKYRWVRSGGNVIRRPDGSGEFFGISLDITSQMEEQQKRLLGAVPLSPDVLAKANIGLWSFELDEGQPPRMYVDETMLGLIGLDHQVPPEETYHAWYDHIDKDAYGLVNDAVAKMIAGDHAEVQYPWHHPDGHTMIVRCGGVRNQGYKKGIRIEGTHQNVSEVLHYDDAEVKRLRAREIELMHAEFRASAIAYVTEHEGDVESFLNYFAERLRELIHCDQVIYQGADGKDIVKSSPEFKDFQFDYEICGKCPHQDYRSPVYAKGVTEMEDHSKGFEGAFPPKECPVKSSLTRIVYLDGKPNGYLAIHYLRNYHTYTDYERQTLEEFTNLLSLSLSRYAARTENAQLSEELELKRQIEVQKDQLEKNMQMIEGLASGYDALYYINVDEGILNVYTLNEEKYPGSKKIFEGKKDIYELVKAYGLSGHIHPDDRHLFEDFSANMIREKLTGQKKYTMRFRVDTGNAYRWDEMDIIKSEDINEQANAVAVGFADRDSDIRKEQEYQLQLKEARVTAENASKAKTNFLFNMSHDIRTPMNAITGFTHMAIKHIDEKEKALDCLDKIQKSGSLLLSLVNSILEVSRIEAGKATLDAQCGDVYYSFANVDNTMQELAKAKDIKLTFDFGKITDRYVYADFSSCIRIFVNVISNAIKYTPEGGRVKVHCEQLGEAQDGCGIYQYTIADNGIGMSEEFQKHVFEQFSREKTTTVSGIQGSGLGMSVVKAFVELMGGTIVCRSKQGVGTTFIITLPFKLQDGEKYTDPNSGEVVTPNERGGANAVFDLRGRRVLLVEDNELNREIAVELLGEEGMLVEEAEDGSKAVEILKAKGPDYYDFVLMDIQMPIMNGYEATKQIRAMYPDAKLPILALSANAFAEDKAASLASGMNDHVAKPIKIKELLTALARYL